VGTKGQCFKLKEQPLELIRKKFEARKRQIKREHDSKIKQLEKKIEQFKRERDAKLAKADKRCSKDFSIVFKSLIGEEDYRWLCEWLLKNKESNIKEAQKKHEKRRAEELKNLNVEDYFFYYFNNPKIGLQLKKDAERSKPEEVKRLSFILAKVDLEKYRLDRTRIELLYQPTGAEND